MSTNLKNAKVFKMSIYMHVLNTRLEPLGYEIKDIHNRHNWIIAPIKGVKGGVSFTAHLSDAFLDDDNAIRFYSYFQLPNWYCDITNCDTATKMEIGSHNDPIASIHTLDVEKNYLSREFADQSNYVLYTLEQVIQIINRSNDLAVILKKYKIDDTAEYGPLTLAKGMTLYQMWSKRSEKNHIVDGDWYMFYFPKNRELKFDAINIKVGGPDFLLNKDGEFESMLTRMIALSKVNAEIQKTYRDTIKKLNEELTPRLNLAKETFFNAL